MNKKGSSTILLTMILSAMILLVLALVQIAVQVSGTSVGQSVLLLSGRSVLSEFDKNLKKEYGILAFRGQTGELATKLSFYADPFFDQNRYHKFRDIKVRTAEQRLSDPQVFEKTIVDYTAYGLAKGMIDDLSEAEPAPPSNQVSPEGGQRKRCLRNQQIIQNLPSYQMGDPPGVIQTMINHVGQLDHLIKKGTDNYLVNLYIMSHFRNAQNDIPSKETFFDNEVEYILKGDFDDSRNREKVRNELLLLRNTINITFLLSDAEMKGKLVAAANIVSPGPGAGVAMLMLAESWALAEAENDVRILEHGKRVPIYKNTQNWAVDLKSILENRETGYIDTGSKSGLDYQGYLQLLLFFLDNTTKLCRTMDLMQINIQGNYDKTFLIQDHQVGLSYESTINSIRIQGETQY